MPAADSEDEDEDFQTADLDDPLWDKEPVPDSMEYLCMHEIPMLATPQLIPVTPPLHPGQGAPATLPQQPDPVEASLEFELMELNIPDDKPDLLDIPAEVMFNFNARAQHVLSY